MKTRNQRKEQLYGVAESQCGLFTTKQAKATGYTENNFPHHISAGSWIREHRGIYRLARFPDADESQLVLWSLWSRDRKEIAQAVYSHQTALRIHVLSDSMPAKLHVTVPTTFRRNSAIPSVLVLHRANLSPTDLQDMRGFRVTRPLRTLLDLVGAQTVSPDLIEQALRQGLARGLITRADIRVHKGEPDVAAILRGCLARIDK